MPSLVVADAPSSRLDEWVPEVEYVGVLLAILDRVFDGDQPRFLAWVTESNMRRAPAVASASLDGETVKQFVDMAPVLWNRLHRGTSIRIRLFERGNAELELAHPIRLFPPIMLEYFARLLAVIIVRFDGVQPSIEIVTSADDEAMASTVFSARWT